MDILEKTVSQFNTAFIKKISNACLKCNERLCLVLPDPLKAPENLTAIIRGPSRALLRWLPVPPSTVRGHFKGYKIETWTVAEGESRKREMKVLANTTEAEVNIFIPFALNFVQVRAYNGRFDGPPSQGLSLYMPEGTPGPVKYLDAIAMGSSTLKLIWEKPIDPNGNLTGYRIYYEKG